MSFSLAGKGLKLDTEADAAPHFKSLLESTNITSIDLSGNTLGVGACEALAKAILPSKDTLKFADLHDIFTQRLVDEIPPALDAIVASFLQCPNLETVDLSDNAFGLKTKDPLVTFLSKHVPLRHLILNNNGMGPIAGTSIAEALLELAQKKDAARTEGKDVPDLESVVCGRNRLENGSMEAWAAAYRAHGKVKSVKMTQNGIRPEGIMAVVGGLATCTGLEVFDLQDNTFTIQGANALAKAVTKWPELKELGVGDDLLGARGSIKVFEALGGGGNKNVEVLRLEFNDITPAGVKALVQAAKDGLPNLRRVELNGNKFEEDDSGVEELSALLEERKDEKGSDEDPENHWGLGELDELEGEDEDEEEEDVEDDEDEERREKVVHDADLAEDESVSQKKDADVDDLADLLDKSKISK